MEELFPEADWTPTPEQISESNIAWLMREANVESYSALHAWSSKHRDLYWDTAIRRLGIVFKQPYSAALDVSQGVESPQWLVGSEMNIVDSCFGAADDSAAIVHQTEGGTLQTTSVATLRDMAGRVAASIEKQGWQPGDALAVFMPMNVECIAIYLGIIQAGCVAVSIADSFRPPEIEKRLRLSHAVGIFTQELTHRGSKTHPMYANLQDIAPPTCIVITESNESKLANGDISWHDFLVGEPSLTTVARIPGDPLNILFSSGTTGDPKAIPWTQTSPIKAAADGHFHHDIRPGDVVVWPTNLGWMMGPWLIFASLLNRATIGLFDGAPTGPGFCQFVQDAKTTMLGLVPSIIKAWRSTGATDGLDWSSIRAFSSTGECSNADDMRWLMQQAGGRPVIEYCGGTEVGGGYLTSVVTLPNVAGAFNAPALGMDFVILDENNSPSSNGEVYLVPPSIGLSTVLLNKDHHEVYYEGSPTGPQGETLRRHGDQLEALPGGFWRALGRVDNTMNLGGIKVSSAEIEQTLQSVRGIRDCAAIAVSPQGGPSSLVIYAVITDDAAALEQLISALQTAIKRELNPLFKIHEVIPIESLPRTASNKVMHRVLRDQYLSRS